MIETALFSVVVILVIVLPVVIWTLVLYFAYRLIARHLPLGPPRGFGPGPERGLVIGMLTAVDIVEGVTEHNAT